MRCLFLKLTTVSLCLFLAFFLALTAAAADHPRNSSASPSQSAHQADASAVDRLGDLPLSFESNEGQTDPQVRFLSRGSGYSFFLTQTGAVLSLAQGTHSPAVLQMQLRGANANARVDGVDPLTGKSNYFFGRDSQHWRTGVTTYSRVAYDSIYPGINLLYYGNQRQLEYDFVLAPYADPNQIQVAVSGAQNLTVDSSGNLVLRNEGGQVQLLAPKVYQIVDGHKREIAGQWKLNSASVAGFHLGRYDHSRTLIIDPVLLYSSFLGGSQNNVLNKIAVDAAGNTYVAGYTASGDFPTAPTPQALTFGNGTPMRGAFVSKIDPTGKTLLYSTYLSGSANEQATGLAVDVSGNVYVAGTTHSTDFPTSNAFQSTCASQAAAAGCSSAFLAKIGPTGDSLIYSTYLGGSAGESANGLAVDALGSAYVVGVTSSVNFPVSSGAAQTKCGGACQQNAFVAKFDPTGASLVYATYLGGSGTDNAADIALDSSTNVYVTGETTSPDFPVNAAFQKSCTADTTSSANACLATAFVTKLKSDGSAFTYSTYLGGSLGSQGSAITVDAKGSAYVAGSTQSPDFPVVNAYQKSCAVDQTSKLCTTDAFVTKLDPTGKTLTYSTYLGGSGTDQVSGIALDKSGNAYIVGNTESADFPTRSALQSKLKGPSDAFVAVLSSAGNALIFSTYHGGSATESGNGIALDAKGTVYVTGQTSSTDFPTQHPFQSSCAGACTNAFVSAISPLALSASTTTLTSNLNPSSFGGSVTFTAVVSGSGVTPTGTVDFFDGATNIGSGTLDATGTTSISTSTLTVGSHSITADYEGDVNYAASTSNTVTQVVNVAVSVSPATALVEVSQVAQFTATVTGSSNTNVTWSLNCITAPCGTITNATANPATYTAPAPGSLPGSVTITATSQADSTQSSSATITVDDFSISLSAAAATVIQGSTAIPQITLTATGSNGYTGSVTPGCANQPSGVTCTGPAVNLTSSTTTGTSAMTISAGSTATTGASSGMSVIGTDAAGNKVTHTVAFSLTVCSVAFSGTTPPANVNADASSGNNFNVTLTGGNCAWTASSDAAWLTISPASGTGSGTATWGVTANSGSGATARTGHITIAGTTFTVTQAAGSVSVAPTTATVEVSQTSQFTATVTGLTNTAVTWSLACTTAPCGTLSPTATSNPVTYTAPAPGSTPGTVTLTATSQADNTKTASATITVSDFSVSLSASSATVIQGQSVTPAITATVTGSNGYAGTVTPGCASQPTGVTCSGSAVALTNTTTTGTTTVTISASSTATTGASSGMTITGTDAAGTKVTHSVPFSLTVCSVAFSGTTPPANVNADASTGNNFTVTLTGGNCAWTASSDQTWLTISPASGSGTGTATWGVTANNGSGATTRTGHITIAGTVFTVTQSAVSLTVAPTTATVEVTQTASFTATITGATNQGITWSLSCTTTPCGTLTPNNTANPVTYTAPAAGSTPGPVTLTATSQEDSSKTANATITVTDYSLTSSATDVDVLTTGTSSTGNQTNTLTARGSNGYTGSVGTLTCNGLPAGATCSFNPTSVSLSSTTTSGTSTVSFTTASAAAGTYTISVSGTDAAGVSHTTGTFTLHVVSVTLPPLLPTTIEVNQSTPFSGTVQGSPLLGGVADNNIDWSLSCGSANCGGLSPSTPSTQVTYGTTSFYTAANSASETLPTVTLTGKADAYSAASASTSPIAVTDYAIVLPATTAIAIEGSNGSSQTYAAPINGYLPTSVTGTQCAVSATTAFTSGPTCTVGSPINVGNPPANQAAVSITTAAATPIGLYSATVSASDSATTPVTHNASQLFSVQCPLSLQSAAPSFTPAAGSGTSTTPNEYSVSVSVAQNGTGTGCLYGNTAVVGGVTPGAAAGDTKVVTNIVSGATGTGNATSIVFTTCAPQGTTNPCPALPTTGGSLTAPYFDATATADINTTSATIPNVVVEAPTSVTLTGGAAGTQSGSAPLTVTSLTGNSNQLTIPTIPSTSTYCGVIGPNGPDATGDMTCTWTSGSSVTITYNPSVSASNRASRNRASGFWLGLLIPAMLLIGGGLSAGNKNSRQRRFVVLVALCIAITILLASCGGGGFSGQILQSGTGTYTVTAMGYTTPAGGTASATNQVQSLEIFTISVSLAQ